MMLKVPDGVILKTMPTLLEPPDEVMP